MVDYRSDNIYGSFEAVATSVADKTALVFLGESFTFRRVRDLVIRLAGSLHHMGIGKDDKVILYLYNIPQMIVAQLALQRLNAVAVPVAPVYGSHDLKYLANDSGAETIFCMDSNFNYVNEVAGDTPLKNIIATNMIDLLPWWKKLLARGFDRVPRGMLPSGEGCFTFMKLVNEGRLTDLPEFEPPPPDQISMILYTGGTTGFPKGVPLSVGQFLYKTVEWRRATEGLIAEGKGVTVLSAPLYHIIGQMDAFTPLVVGGETLVMLPRVVLDALFDHIQRYRASSMFAVPTLYRMMLEHDRLNLYDLSSLKYCGVGGDVLPPEVGNWWLDRFNIPLYQGYGTTEFCGAISMSYAKDGIPPQGAAGKVMPGDKAKVVDPSTLEPVPEGQPGELLGTSIHPVRSYWNKPAETKDSFLEIDGETWYRTKDMVRIDADGWLYFMDRSVDMIKHKGYRVAAAEIERILQEHTAVLAACVVGVPDEKLGERIKAFVVLKTDTRGVSSYELTRWCKDRLAPYKVPHYIEFRDMLPKSKVGKMLRREMRAEERRKVNG